MAIIRFGEWLPDLPEFNNPGSTIANNCIPHLLSYKSLNSLNEVGNSALDAFCRGGIALKDTSGNGRIFVGDSTKLYGLAGSSYTSTNLSRLAGYATLGTDIFWHFSKWGNEVVATTPEFPLQAHTIINSGSFSDVIVSTTKPQGRYINVVRDFAVMGNLNYGGSSFEERVGWSGIDDITNWSFGSAAIQSDIQDLRGLGGDITGVVGGEYGVIFRERSIHRMDYIGPPLVFQFSEVDQFRGCIAPKSIVKVGRNIFYLSYDGFYRFDGNTSIPISENKTSKTFFDDLDIANLPRINGVADPNKSIIMWSYPGTGSVGGEPNKIIIYDWWKDRWSDANVINECLFSALTTAVSIDDPQFQTGGTFGDLDAMTVSLDDRAFKGGDLQIGGFTTNSKFGLFSGNPLTAVLETKSFQITPYRRTIIHGFRPYIDMGSSLTAQVGSKDLQKDDIAFGPILSQNSTDGEFKTRNNSRFHKIRMTIADGFDDAQGVEITQAVPEGVR